MLEPLPLMGIALSRNLCLLGSLLLLTASGSIP